MQVFKNELQNGRLSQLRIRDPLAGGHSIVVDGYMDTPSEQIHLNMGWSGYYNGWYVANNIVTGSYNWSDVNYQGAVIGIEPPTTFTVSVKPTSSTDIVLRWQDKSLGESGFKVQRKTGACTALSAWADIANLPANTVTFTNSGLTAATTYAYRIISFDSHGASQYSPCVSSATAVAGTTSAPTGLNAAAGPSSINLAWTDNSTNETRFDVYRKVGTGVWTLMTHAGPGVLSFSDSTAAGYNATSYSYYVKACNASGCSPSSSISVIPFNPVSLSATQLRTTLNLSWTDQSANETGFKLERKLGACSSTDKWAVKAVLHANTGQYADAGLTTGLTYSYRVKAYKRSAALPYAFGNSQYSNCVTKTLQ
jgi:Rieske Fe-S protein